MSMTFPCRIRCSKATYEALYVPEYDDNLDYIPDIDFYKALDLKGENTKKLQSKSNDKVNIDYSMGFDIKMINDDLYDIGFEVHQHPGYRTIEAVIENYHDLEWWYNDEYTYIYHWYWQDDAVIEDIHMIDDEEDREMDADEDNQFHVIYTKRMPQNQYINFKPDKKSVEYKKYVTEVNRIARKVVKDSPSYIYGFNFDVYDTHFDIGTNIREKFLYDKFKDSKYKINIMSYDIIEEILQLKKSRRNK